MYPFFISLTSVFQNPREYLIKYRGYLFDFLRLVLIVWGCLIISLFDLSYMYEYVVFFPVDIITSVA